MPCNEATVPSQGPAAGSMLEEAFLAILLLGVLGSLYECIAAINEHITLRFIGCVVQCSRCEKFSKA